MNTGKQVSVLFVWTGIAMLAAGVACSGSGGTPNPTSDSGTDVPRTDSSVDRDSNAPTDGGQDTTVVGITPVKLMVSPSMVMVTEGGAMPGTFMVTLSQPWSAPITVTLVSANPNVATVVPETLTFGPNKTGPETVMVLATIDDDAADNSTTITLFSQETGSARVAVDVDDMDVQGLLVSPPRVSMTEGRTETLSVRLAKRPASAVVVTLAPSNGTKLALSQTTLTFNAGNFSIPQLVMLSAAQDDDASLDNVTVNLTATGNIPALPVQVEITDDDAVNLDISPPSLNLVERANMPGTINVRLTRAPATDVTVTVASSNPVKATVSPATLTFTPANFDTAQMVQVSAVNDNDARDEIASVTLTASGVTPAPPARMVSIAIDDPDSQMLQVTPTNLTVGEGAMTTFDVRLLLDPGAPVTVNVFSQNPGKLEILPPVLNFSAANFGTVQTVTVRSLQDDDLANDSINVTLASSTAANVNVTVAVTDDDMQAIQLIPVTPGDPLIMQEATLGGTASTSPLGVRLAYRPAGSTTVNLASSNPKLTITPATVTFTPSNYAIAQFVTLGAPHDMDMVNDMADLTATATGVTTAHLGVQILDTDIQNFNVSAAALGPIAEGMTSQFTVRLTVQPAAPVMANVTSSRDTKVSVSPGLCVLTAANYSSGCVVTVTAVDEMPDDTRDETATITIADVEGVIPSRTVGILVDDTDTQALVVTPLATNPVGEGNSSTFTVALMFNPIDPVVVSVFSQSPSKLEVNLPVLNFNSTNFSVPQTVTVTTMQDDDLVSEGPTSTPPARITVTGLAAGASNAAVDVNITDNDMQAIVLTPTTSTGSPTVIQEGSISQIGVRLAFRPAANVTVSLISSSTLLDISAASVTFTPMNYSVTQFVTLTAPRDPNMIDDNVTITAAVTGMGLSTTHYVRITDIDMLNFDLSATSLGAIAEGGMTTFVVKLTVVPATSVSPSLSSSNASVTAAFASPCTLNAGNYMTGCTVNVTAVEENNALNENAVITVSDPVAVDGPNMRPIAARTVSTATTDNDTQALMLEGAANPEILSEGSGMQTFVVKLAADPVTPVTITLTPSQANQVTVTSSPSSCVLTTENYTATGCTVTITGLEDLDLVDQNLSIRVSAAPISVSDAFVNVRKTDNDTQALVLRMPTSVMGVETCGLETPRLPTAAPPGDDVGIIEVIEGAAGHKVCVSLAFQPDVTNTVSLTPSLPAKFGTAPASLMFNNTNYFISKDVTITGSEDADTANVTGATATVSVVPLAPEKTIDVRVLDNDRTLTVTPTLGGSISSSPAGIDMCTSTSAAGTCNETYISLADTVVTLTATPSVTPSPGWTFGAFAGSTGCSGGMVTMSAARTCTATFRPNLAVTVVGMGTVASTGGTPGTGAQIACPGTCGQNFTIGDAVTLTAMPTAGSMFTGFSGDCTGTAPFAVTMSAPRACTATFELIGP